MNESKIVYCGKYKSNIERSIFDNQLINNKCFVTRNFPITKLHLDIVSLNKPLSVFVYELYK